MTEWSDEEIGAFFYKSIHDWDARRARSLQSEEGKIGISSLGHCSELVRRTLAGEREEPTDAWAAILGTVAGDAIEEAVKQSSERGEFPEVIIQSEFTVPLKVNVMGKDYQFNILAHADVIVPSLGLVLDNKGTAKFEMIKRYGMTDRQKKFQRHLYLWGAWNAGLLGDFALEDCRVGNVWHDRSAANKEFYCATEPFDMAVVREAEEWLGGAVYAFLNKTSAEREPSREFCAEYCGFFNTCRALDTDAEGLLTDPEVLQAVELRLEARDHEATAKRLKAEAERVLAGISGSTGTHVVRWVTVPGGHVEYDRASYTKLSLSKAPRKKE